MTYLTKSALLAALIVPGFALANANVGDALGTNEDDVRAALAGLGYEVLEIEVEEDEIEADVALNGEAFEIEVAADTGLITDIELENENDDEDDDDADDS